MAFKPKIKKLDLYGRVPIGTSDPASGTDGDLFYNTTDEAFRIWITDAWVDIGSATASSIYDTGVYGTAVYA